MRWYKKLARILLVLSVIDFALAAPVVAQGHEVRISVVDAAIDGKGAPTISGRSGSTHEQVPREDNPGSSTDSSGSLEPSNPAPHLYDEPDPMNSLLPHGNTYLNHCPGPEPTDNPALTDDSHPFNLASPSDSHPLRPGLSLAHDDDLNSLSSYSSHFKSLSDSELMSPTHPPGSPQPEAALPPDDSHPPGSPQVALSPDDSHPPGFPKAALSSDGSHPPGFPKTALSPDDSYPPGFPKTAVSPDDSHSGSSWLPQHHVSPPAGLSGLSQEDLVPFPPSSKFKYLSELPTPETPSSSEESHSSWAQTDYHSSSSSSSANSWEPERPLSPLANLPGSSQDHAPSPPDSEFVSHPGSLSTPTHDGPPPGDSPQTSSSPHESFSSWVQTDSDSHSSSSSWWSHQQQHVPSTASSQALPQDHVPSQPGSEFKPLPELLSPPMHDPSPATPGPIENQPPPAPPSNPGPSTEPNPPPSAKRPRPDEPESWDSLSKIFKGRIKRRFSSRRRAFTIGRTSPQLYPFSTNTLTLWLIIVR